jgi:hypothetical protein
VSREEIWEAINGYVANLGGHPGLRPHEQVIGEAYGREQVAVIESFMQELEELRHMREELRNCLLSAPCETEPECEREER